MSSYLNTLSQEFKSNANAQIALQQKAYMRYQFEYYGLKAPVRQSLQKPFLVKEYLPKNDQLNELIKTLWEKPQREYQHFGQDLVFKYVKHFEQKDIALFEYMVIHKSWWDTVDFIANKLMGAYFKQFPELRETYVKKWLQSGNIWLQRSALLFQLKYRQDLDTNLLSNTINHLLGSKEFFINKAIGWVLREYSRTNPQWVQTFVNNSSLSPLSKKEALRLLG